MAVGLAGTLLPILPGLLLMWVAAVAYGLGSGLDGLAFGFLIAVSVIVLLALWLGVRLPQKGAARAGVGTGVQLLALAAAVVGFFVIPVVGAAVGFVLAIFGVQLSRTGTASEAWAATRSALFGLMQAAAAQFGAGLLVVAVWVVWVLVD